VNKQKFAISWIIDVSTGEDSIIKSLAGLAEKRGVSYDELFHTIEQKAENEDIILLLDNVGGTRLIVIGLKGCGAPDVQFTSSSQPIILLWMSMMQSNSG
jgi:hypothetical protein